MIAYLDTSAIVPLLIREPSSELCARVWNTADDVATHQIAYVECAAALAAARRGRRITSTAHRNALSALDSYWSEIAIVPLDDELVASAASLAETQALRGYDAIHCASAARLSATTMAAVTGDRLLLAAWRDLGVNTIDIHTP